MFVSIHCIRSMEITALATFVCDIKISTPNAASNIYVERSFLLMTFYSVVRFLPNVVWSGVVKEREMRNLWLIPKNSFYNKIEIQ